MAVFTATGLLAGAEATGFKPVKFVKGLFGSSKKFTSCGAKQAEFRRAIDQYLSPTEIQQFMRDHERNVGDIQSADATGMAFHLSGGDDCKTTSSKGKAWNRRVIARIESNAESLTQTQNETKPLNQNPVSAGKISLSNNNLLIVAGAIIAALIFFRGNFG